MPNAPFTLMRRMRRFAIDRKGVAAVEFAYIAPLLILALFGTIEVSRAVMVHKRVQRVTAMIGDLVSREESIGTAAGTAVPVLNGMMLSAQHVMYPFSIDSLNVTIRSMRAKSDNANRTLVDWYYNSVQGVANSPCQERAMPTTGMLGTGNTAIVVESSYDYTPLLGRLVPGFRSGAIKWNDTITHSPRKKSCVEFETTKCSEFCPAVNW